MTARIASANLPISYGWRKDVPTARQSVTGETPKSIIESDSVRKSVEGEPPGDTESDAPAAPRRAAK